ncbi:acyl-CoA thioester hydrolase/BAAT C-terminal domain-containing protein [Qipengyuania sp. DGS5-3]|uniref:acyl-CoA thioester hydrolase/BAAT C-terminal domain-containing protein n=1 Tax=Qipengyuania sp. DGS5-3 TaxID=3349632 RepID=UPI0036D294C5
MRGRKTLLSAMAIAALLGGAALFQQAAPERYGLPEIEVLDPGTTGQRIDQAGLFGNYYPAKRTEDAIHADRRPAVLLLGGSEGGLGSGAKHMALSLQEEGFTVLHLAYFGAPGQPEALERIPIEGFDQALDWLKQQPGVDPQRLSVVGASKGAEAALIIASRRDDLSAVVGGMPTSVAWNGINWASSGQSPYSSWTIGGKQVATMPFSDWQASEGIISVYRAVEDPALSAAAERAAIPIEQASAGIMLVCGEAETMWPACPMSRMIAKRSAQKSGPAVSVLAYPDAGHFVFGPPMETDSPFYERLDMFGGSVEGNAKARAESWPKVVAFLKEMAPQ